ncbi:uroporphyrinogen-III C-methyltransferase [Sulfurimonas sp. SAG-AH-194-C20]|nr:uroporphyrinogen-III C-methyltransferase [Sulfurimonas sp. SAG-AH-194-C20]MDF1878455.1 uroporphyrinogen-III C-methyltransferase [Sulfurimonas sp. SAG-AH-194-C20]
MGRVYLTGAGPGDLDLLTVKALRMIQKADIIIYDRLANAEILKEVKDGCEFLYVGKEDAKHTIPQNEINEILFKASLKHDNIVRLKGGDPFVFGRGGEEALFLKDKNVAFEIIPGISSAISVPAYAGIPVTHRGISTAFKVVTGHISADKDSSNINWNDLKSDDTIVFLMGLKNIDIICEKLLSLGKPKEYPVAVISRGTTPEQKVVVGTLEDITQKSKGLATPALIVIGEVVKLREKLQWFESR